VITDSIVETQYTGIVFCIVTDGQTDKSHGWIMLGIDSFTMLMCDNKLSGCRSHNRTVTGQSSVVCNTGALMQTVSHTGSLDALTLKSHLTGHTAPHRNSPHRTSFSKSTDSTLFHSDHTQFPASVTVCLSIHYWNTVTWHLSPGWGSCI